MGIELHIQEGGEKQRHILSMYVQKSAAARIVLNEGCDNHSGEAGRL